MRYCCGLLLKIVARLESGQRRLDVIEFIQLAEILDFDAPELMAEVGKIAI